MSNNGMSDESIEYNTDDLIQDQQAIDELTYSIKTLQFQMNSIDDDGHFEELNEYTPYISDQEKIASLTRTIEKYESDNQKHLKILKKSHERMNKHIAKLKKSNFDLQSQMDEVMQKNEALKTENVQLKEQIESKVIIENYHKMEDLNSIATKQDNLSDLLLRISKRIQRSSTFSSIECNSDMAILKEQIDGYSKDMQRLSAFMNATKNVPISVDVDRLKQELNETRKESKKKDLRVTELLSEMHHLRDDNVLQQKMSIKDEMIVRLKQRLKDNEREIGEQRERLTESPHTNKREIDIYNLVLTKTIGTLQAYNKQLHLTLSDFDVKDHQKKKKFENRKSIANVFEKMQIQNTSKDNLKSMINEIDSLINHIQIFMNILDECNVEKLSLIREVQMLTSTNSELRKQNIKFQTPQNEFNELKHPKERNKILHKFIVELWKFIDKDTEFEMNEENIGKLSNNGLGKLMKEVIQLSTIKVALSTNKNDKFAESMKRQMEKMEVQTEECEHKILSLTTSKRALNEIVFSFIAGINLSHDNNNECDLESIKNKLNEISKSYKIIVSENAAYIDKTERTQQRLHMFETFICYILDHKDDIAHIPNAALIERMNEFKYRMNNAFESFEATNIENAFKKAIVKCERADAVLKDTNNAMTELQQSLFAKERQLKMIKSGGISSETLDEMQIENKNLQTRIKQLEQMNDSLEVELTTSTHQSIENLKNITKQNEVIEHEFNAKLSKQETQIIDMKQRMAILYRFIGQISTHDAFSSNVNSKMDKKELQTKCDEIESVISNILESNEDKVAMQQRCNKLSDKLRESNANNVKLKQIAQCAEEKYFEIVANDQLTAMQQQQQNKNGESFEDKVLKKNVHDLNKQLLSTQQVTMIFYEFLRKLVSDNCIMTNVNSLMNASNLRSDELENILTAIGDQIKAKLSDLSQNQMVIGNNDSLYQKLQANAQQIRALKQSLTNAEEQNRVINEVKIKQEQHLMEQIKAKECEMNKLQKILSEQNNATHFKEFNVFHQIASDAIHHSETVSAESVIHNISDQELRRNISNLNELYNQAENITSDHWLEAMLKLGRFLNQTFKIHSIPCQDPPSIDFNLKHPIDRIRVGLSMYSLLRLYLNEVHKTDLLNTECNKMSTDIRHYRKMIDDLNYKAKQSEKTYGKHMLDMQCRIDKSEESAKAIKVREKSLLKEVSTQKTYIGKLERENKGKCVQSHHHQSKKRVFADLSNFDRQKSPRCVKQISALERKIFELEQENKYLKDQKQPRVHPNAKRQIDALQMEVDELKEKNKYFRHSNQPKLPKQRIVSKETQREFEVHRIAIPSQSCTEEQVKRFVNNLNKMYCDPQCIESENWKTPLCKLGQYLNRHFAIHNVPCAEPDKINFILKHPIDRIRVGLSLYCLLRLYLRQKGETESFVAESNKLIADIQNHAQLNEDLHVKMKKMEKEKDENILYWRDECQKNEQKVKVMRSNLLTSTKSTANKYHQIRLSEDLKFKLKQMETEKDKIILHHKLASEKSERQFKETKAKQTELIKVTKKLVSELSAEKRKNKKMQSEMYRSKRL